MSLQGVSMLSGLCLKVAKIYNEPNIFLVLNFFVGAKFFWTQIFLFNEKKILSKIFLIKNIFWGAQNYVGPKIFRTQQFA